MSPQQVGFQRKCSIADREKGVHLTPSSVSQTVPLLNSELNPADHNYSLSVNRNGLYGITLRASLFQLSQSLAQSKPTWLHPDQPAARNGTLKKKKKKRREKRNKLFIYILTEKRKKKKKNEVCRWKCFHIFYVLRKFASSGPSVNSLLPYCKAEHQD